MEQLEERRLLTSVHIDDVVLVENQSFPKLESFHHASIGPIPARVPIHLSRISTNTVTVEYETRESTSVLAADSGGIDFYDTSGTIEFLPGENLKWIDVQIRGDGIEERLREEFEIVLSSPAGATLGDDIATVTIFDDDGSGVGTSGTWQEFTSSGIDELDEVDTQTGNSPLDVVIKLGVPLEEGDLNCNFDPTDPDFGPGGFNVNTFDPAIHTGRGQGCIQGLDDGIGENHGAYLEIDNLNRVVELDLHAELSSWDTYHNDISVPANGFWDSFGVSVLSAPVYDDNIYEPITLPGPICNAPCTDIPINAALLDGTEVNATGDWYFLEGADFYADGTVAQHEDGNVWSETFSTSISLDFQGMDYLNVALDTLSSGAVAGAVDGRFASYGEITLTESNPVNEWLVPHGFETEAFGPGWAFFVLQCTDGYGNVLASACDNHEYRIVDDQEADFRPVEPSSFSNGTTLILHQFDTSQLAEGASFLDFDIEVRNSECVLNGDLVDCSSPNEVISTATSRVHITNPNPMAENGPHVTNVAVSSSVAPTQPLYEIPMGLGEQLLPLPMASIDTIHVKFDEEVLIVGDELEIVGLNSGENFSLTFEGFTTDTNVGTWKLDSGTFGPDRIWMRLNDSITDLQGNNLDGEWLNPVSPGDTRVVLPFSGDTIEGGDFTYAFVVLPAGAGGSNGTPDWVVDSSDFNVWNANKFQLNTTWQTGDYNGDGKTDGTDFGIWITHRFTSVQLTTFTDLNHNGTTDENDLIHLMDAIFGRRAAETFDDINGDGLVDRYDAHHLFNLLSLEFGDVIMDGEVNIYDTMFFSVFGADLDNDGDIDEDDLNTFFDL